MFGDLWCFLTELLPCKHEWVELNSWYTCGVGSMPYYYIKEKCNKCPITRVRQV